MIDRERKWQPKAGHLSFHYSDQSTSCPDSDKNHRWARTSERKLSYSLSPDIRPTSATFTGLSCQAATLSRATCANERPTRPSRARLVRTTSSVRVLHGLGLLRPKSGRVFGVGGAGPTTPTEGDADDSCFCEGPVQLGAWTACDNTLSFCPSHS